MPSWKQIAIIAAVVLVVVAVVWRIATIRKAVTGGA